MRNSIRLTGLMTAALMISITGLQADDDAQPLSYHKDVEKIFQAKCQECHRPDQLAPMSLLEYNDIRPWAKAIRKSVLEKEMPPWDAAPGYGPFVGDYSLTEDEQRTIIQWIDSGALQGNPDDAPDPVTWDDSGWRAGEPDLVLQLPEPYMVPATENNEDLYQCLVIPTNFEKDTWVDGFEYRPGNYQVVHHMIGSVDTSGKALALDKQTPEPGYPCSMGGNFGGLDAMLGGWAPGMQPNMMRNGLGKMLKANSVIILQMHYFNRTGVEQPDHSSVGIHLAKDTIHKKTRIHPVSAWKLDIPAGDPNAEHKAIWRLSRDIDIHSIMPHMHYIGKDMTISLTWPDGKHEKVLEVPRYDFDWQLIYSYVEPLRIPKGSTIHMLSHHDNSADNPNNPSNPPIDVVWGESTTEEMAIGWLGYTLADEDLKIDPTK